MAVDLGSAVAYLKLNTSQFDSSLTNSERRLSSTGAKLAGTIGKGLAAAYTAIGTGMVAFGKSSVEAGQKFDTSMSQVAATLGTTVDQIGNLREFAMEMGASTVFSATEAADALNYMALAGYDADKSMEMLPTVLSLAAAGSMDLAKASDMVTDAESALNLKTGEAATMVDQMAKAASKSNTSVEQLGEAILTIGGTANLMAGGTERLTTVLGILADNGIKGSEAGTHLRNMLLKLSDPTKEGAEAIKALGLEIFNSDGEMRDMEDIVLDLNESLSTLTDEQRIKYISAMFNSRDIAAVNALLNTSKQRWDELGDAIVESKDAAKQMADTQLDNLNGDITLFKSALEGAKITLSDRLTPTLRKFVQFGTKEIGKLDKAFKTGGLSGFSKQLGKTLADGVSAIIKYVPKFVSAVVKLGTSLIENFLDTTVKNFPKIMKEFGSLLERLATGLSEKLPDILGKIGEFVGKLISETPRLIELGLKIVAGLTVGILKGIPELLSGVWNGIKGIFSEPISDDVKIAQQELEDLKESFSDIGKETEEMHENFNQIDADYRMSEYWLGVFEELSQKTSLTRGEEELLKKAVQELNGVLPETSQIVQDETGKWIANTDEIKNNIEAIKLRAKAEVYYDKMRSEMERLVDTEIKLSEEQEKLNNLYDKQKEIEPLYNKWNKGFEYMYSAVNDLVGANQELNYHWDAGTEEMKAYAEQIGITEDNFVSWSDVTSKFSAKQKELGEQLSDTNKQIEISEDTVSTLEDAIDSINGAIDKFGDKASGILADAEKSGEDLGDAYAKGILAAKAKIVRAAKDVGYDAAKAFSSARGPWDKVNIEGAYATGLDYVPRTMDVTVHRGERILTQEENKRYNEGGSIEVKTYQNDQALLTLGSKLDKILDAIDKIDEMQMVVDGKKLVGAIKREMNSQLADDYVLA